MDERLQKFARLTEIGSFTKAAKILHISQPALSIAVDKLERELGAELLIRSNRKLELTEAGRAAYKTALEHQSATDHLRTELSRITKQRPAVTIGMTDSVAAILCTTPAFDALEQAADVTIVVNNSRYLREAVEHRQLDVAFVVDDGGEHSGLNVQPAGTEELVLVCHPDVLAETEADLARGHLRNFICYDKPSTTYRHIVQTLREYDIKPHISLFSTSPDVMLAMVHRSKGVSALPRFMVDGLIETGELSRLSRNRKEDLTINRPLCFIQPPGKTLPKCLSDFCKEVQL